MSKNASLNDANKAKQDEFYTQLRDIEVELYHYWSPVNYFAGKTVFCNCDDPETSNFWTYFEKKFDELNLKKLVATHFDARERSYKLELIRDINQDGKVNDKDIVRTMLVQNGDFRSPECIEILQGSDIVVTNPPFSLFREYIAQLMQYEKKFIIIGSLNAITYKEIFPLLRDNKMWLGYGFQAGNAYFSIRHEKEYAAGVFNKDTGLVKFRNVCWYTNFDIPKHHEKLLLTRQYRPDKYPVYDNYNAINVNKVSEIPGDYDGVMGVPVTFLDKYNPDQFEIVGIDRYVEDNKNYGKRFTIQGKETYARILIKRKEIAP